MKERKLIKEFKAISEVGNPVLAKNIVEDLPRKYPRITSGMILTELHKMKDEGILSWEGGGFGPNTVIKLKS